MGRDKKGWAVILLASSLFSAVLAAAFLSDYYNRACFQAIGSICGEIIEARPDVEKTLLSVLKEGEYRSAVPSEQNILRAYGYGETDILPTVAVPGRIFILVGFLGSGGLFLCILRAGRRREGERIQALTAYLERVNRGEGGQLFQVDEGEFSKLQDELYKTVTALYQARDAALAARNNFADNLSNIAHQIKTPITAASLSVQLMRKEPSDTHLDHISGQLARLTHLEEALLLLARMEAGTLGLKRKEADVFTVLMLAADNLQELLAEEDITIDIPEAGGMEIYVDPEWTMEAFMNLFKNCMEHTPSGGCIHCSYAQNPIYTQIRIWDEGEGFDEEDLPHLFERFYRGRRSKNGGIGIGLPLARGIIEGQNGSLRALNLPEGGACYEIRLYSH